MGGKGRSVSVRRYIANYLGSPEAKRPHRAEVVSSGGRVKTEDGRWRKNPNEKLNKMRESEKPHIKLLIKTNSRLRKTRRARKKKRNVGEFLVDLFGTPIDDVDIKTAKKAKKALPGSVRTVKRDVDGGARKVQIKQATLAETEDSRADYASVCDLIIPTIFTDSANVVVVVSDAPLHTAEVADGPTVGVPETMKETSSAVIDLTQEDGFEGIRIEIKTDIRIESDQAVGNSEQANAPASAPPAPLLSPASPTEPTHAEAVLPQSSPAQKQTALDQAMTERAPMAKPEIRKTYGRRSYQPYAKSQQSDLFKNMASENRQREAIRVKHSLLEDLATRTSNHTNSFGNLQNQNAFGSQQNQSSIQAGSVPRSDQSGTFKRLVITIPSQQCMNANQENLQGRINFQFPENNIYDQRSQKLYSQNSIGLYRKNNQETPLLPHGVASHQNVLPIRQPQPSQFLSPSSSSSSSQPTSTILPQMLRLMKSAQRPVEYQNVSHVVCAEKIYPHINNFTQYTAYMKQHEGAMRRFFNEGEFRSERTKFFEYWQSVVVIFGRRLLADLSAVNVPDFNLFQLLVHLATKLIESGQCCTTVRTFGYIKLLVEQLEDQCTTPFLKSIFKAVKATSKRMEERAVSKMTLVQMKQLEAQILQFKRIDAWLQIHLNKPNNTPASFEQSFPHQRPRAAGNEGGGTAATKTHHAPSSNRSGATSTEAAGVNAEGSNVQNTETRSNIETSPVSCVECNTTTAEETAIKPEAMKLETKIEMIDEVIDLTWIDDCDEKEIMEEVIECKPFPFKVESCDENEPTSGREVVSPADSGLGSPPRAQHSTEGYKCLCGNRAIYVCACNSSMYCSSDCQVKDWVDHQKLCHKLQS